MMLQPLVTKVRKHNMEKVSKVERMERVREVEKAIINLVVRENSDSEASVYHHIIFKC